jgi:hypothetical protein
MVIMNGKRSNGRKLNKAVEDLSGFGHKNVPTILFNNLGLAIAIISLSLSLSACTLFAPPSLQNIQPVTETYIASGGVDDIVRNIQPIVQIPTFTIQRTYEQILTQLPKATPEITRVDEFDLDPVNIETVSNEYKGVEMTTSFITDECISSAVKKISINPSFRNSYGENSEVAISHFTARLFFNIWWTNGIEKHEGPKTDEEFDNFMILWAKAQGTNDPQDWEKVQFVVKGVNDLNDGNGHKKNDIVIWPMYNGETPDGIYPISEYSIAFVRNGANIKNMSTFDWGGWDVSMGTNINIDKLYSYVQVRTEEDLKDYEIFVRRISLTTGWLTNLNGKLKNQDTKDILLRRQSSRYDSVFLFDK